MVGCVAAVGRGSSWWWQCWSAGPGAQMVVAGVDVSWAAHGGWWLAGLFLLHVSKGHGGRAEGGAGGCSRGGRRVGWGWGLPACPASCPVVAS